LFCFALSIEIIDYIDLFPSSRFPILSPIIDNDHKY